METSLVYPEGRTANKSDRTPQLFVHGNRSVLAGMCLSYVCVHTHRGTHVYSRGIERDIVRGKNPRSSSTTSRTWRRSPRNRRPVNELQGCKSESWLNCLLSRVEPAFAPLPPFYSVPFAPGGVATVLSGVVGDA